MYQTRKLRRRRLPENFWWPKDNQTNQKIDEDNAAPLRMQEKPDLDMYASVEWKRRMVKRFIDCASTTGPDAEDISPTVSRPGGRAEIESNSDAKASF